VPPPVIGNDTSDGSETFDNGQVTILPKRFFSSSLTPTENKLERFVLSNKFQPVADVIKLFTAVSYDIS
jgi:hypothetical protein